MTDLPTLEDVARLSRTSRSTVSRVINNQDGVSEETREKVLSAIQQLNYEPNRHARGLVTGRSHALGVIVPRTVTQVSSHSFFTPVIDGIYKIAHESGYSVLLWIIESQYDGAWLKQHLAQASQIDGALIIPSPSIKTVYTSLLERNIPYVTIGKFLNQQEYYVDIDNQAATCTAVNHLISMGYKHIATIRGLQSEIAGRERFNGYKQALRQAGYPIETHLIMDGDYEESMAYKATEKLIDANCDAIFAANDSMAIGAIHALHAAGRRVAEDVAVVGFDDMPHASFVQPTLTTIRQPLYQFGEIATRFLLDRIRLKTINQTEVPSHIILPTELVVRQSSGARREQEVKEG